MMVEFKMLEREGTISNEFHWVWPIWGCLGKGAYNFETSSEIE